MKDLVNYYPEPKYFYYRKLSLGVQSKLQDNVVVDVITNTINDPSLRSSIRAARCVSIIITRDLLKFLISNADRNARDSNPSFNRHSRRQNSEGDSSNVSTAYDSKTIKSYLCGENGHKKIDCGHYVSEKNCTFCKRRGHIIADCLKKRKQEETTNH